MRYLGLSVCKDEINFLMQQNYLDACQLRGLKMTGGGGILDKMVKLP